MRKEGMSGTVDRRTDEWKDEGEVKRLFPQKRKNFFFPALFTQV